MLLLNEGVIGLHIVHFPCVSCPSSTPCKEGGNYNPQTRRWSRAEEFSVARPLQEGVHTYLVLDTEFADKRIAEARWYDE